MSEDGKGSKPIRRTEKQTEHRSERDLTEWHSPVRMGSARQDNEERHRVAEEIAKSTEFREACALARVAPTIRQALKWGKRTGAAWKVAHE